MQSMLDTASASAPPSTDKKTLIEYKEPMNKPVKCSGYGENTIYWDKKNEHQSTYFQFVTRR
eukprot:5760138-Ditylum_brightwellii.AAC.1